MRGDHHHGILGDRLEEVEHRGAARVVEVRGRFVREQQCRTRHQRARNGEDYGYRDFRQVKLAPYIQDDWRVSKRLTVNAGLRYEWLSNPIERHNNLNNIVTNTQESKSRIMDTDYSKETTNLAKSQIIQQAATAMLAQANQSSQSVLALLK